jgi:hypothetical protein
MKNNAMAVVDVHRNASVAAAKVKDRGVPMRSVKYWM